MAFNFDQQTMTAAEALYKPCLENIAQALRKTCLCHDRARQ
jgi:hypothetical protein